MSGARGGRVRRNGRRSQSIIDSIRKKEGGRRKTEGRVSIDRPCRSFITSVFLLQSSVFEQARHAKGRHYNQGMPMRRGFTLFVLIFIPMVWTDFRLTAEATVNQFP